MSVTIFDKRPPFVRFEEREMGIDADATAKAGRPIPRVVVMACITPHGSKDCFEKIAEEWLAQIKQQALNGGYSIEWKNHFELQYSEWRKGNELPREGTPIKTWAMCTREAATRLIGCGITTVEDLAQFPDSGLGATGLMDGRYWRDIARSWLLEAKDKGANAKILADQNIEIEALKETVARQAARIDKLMARLERDGDEEPRRGPGRPRKDAEAAA
jgi:hypothetical protein